MLQLILVMYLQCSEMEKRAIAYLQDHRDRLLQNEKLCHHDQVLSSNRHGYNSI